MHHYPHLTCVVAERVENVWKRRRRSSSEEGLQGQASPTTWPDRLDIEHIECPWLPTDNNMHNIFGYRTCIISFCSVLQQYWIKEICSNCHLPEGEDTKRMYLCIMMNMSLHCILHFSLWWKNHRYFFQNKFQNLCFDMLLLYYSLPSREALHVEMLTVL